jgi:hypothetical protein
MADSLDFKQGYLMACTTFANLHGEPGMAHEILQQVNITEADVSAMDLSEWDEKGLADIRAEPGADPIKT